MEALRWVAGFSVSLVFGGLVTQYYARRIRKIIGDQDPHFRITIPISLGIVENLFFTLVVAFDLSGLVIGMVAWMGAKMAAHWGVESQGQRLDEIASVRFLVLAGTMTSLLFSILGGLICSGRLWF